MNPFNRTFLLRIALAVPVVAIVGAGLNALLTPATAAAPGADCAAADWAAGGFCARNSAFCERACAGVTQRSETPWYSAFSLSSGVTSSGGSSGTSGGKIASSGQSSGGNSSSSGTSGTSGQSSGQSSGGNSSSSGSSGDNTSGTSGQSSGGNSSSSGTSGTSGQSSGQSSGSSGDNTSSGQSSGEVP